ncbi:PAS domain-containing protein [Desulfonatronospira sp.]|uniref:PAS domain-containing protein n=1 Tax=Desulfonatronospira sp. TaxID=1962951 RepID=UPI00341B5139
MTERKRAEEARHESDERYRTITETVTDYIFTCTIENGEVMKKVQGPRCIAVTGYSAEEFASDIHLWFNMVHPEDVDHVRRYSDRILNGKGFTITWFCQNQVITYGTGH